LHPAMGSPLSSLSSGFASLDYEDAGWQVCDSVKVSPSQHAGFAVIVTRSAADAAGRVWCTKLRDLLPRQQYELRIQAMVGSKAIASERFVLHTPACFTCIVRLTIYDFSPLQSESGKEGRPRQGHGSRSEAQAARRSEGGKEAHEEVCRFNRAQPGDLLRHLVHQKRRRQEEEVILWDVSSILSRFDDSMLPLIQLLREGLSLPFPFATPYF
jgi:hypothetical protein